MKVEANKIKGQLVERGIRQTDIAREVGFTSQYVGLVIAHKRRNPQIEKVVAKSIGRSPRTVFSESVAA
jgi:lambda repressor-like predicted transcriptional regulator